MSALTDFSGLTLSVFYLFSQSILTSVVEDLPQSSAVVENVGKVSGHNTADMQTSQSLMCLRAWTREQRCLLYLLTADSVP